VLSLTDPPDAAPAIPAQPQTGQEAAAVGGQRRLRVGQGAQQRPQSPAEGRRQRREAVVDPAPLPTRRRRWPASTSTRRWRETWYWGAARASQSSQTQARSRVAASRARTRSRVGSPSTWNTWETGGAPRDICIVVHMLPPREVRVKVRRTG